MQTPIDTLRCAINVASELSEKATNLEEMREAEDAYMEARTLEHDALLHVVKRLAFTGTPFHELVSEARTVLELMDIRSMSDT